MDRKTFKFDSETTINGIEDFISVSKTNPGQSIKHLSNPKFQQWLKDIGDQESADFATLISKSINYSLTLEGGPNYNSHQISKTDKLLKNFLIFLIFKHPLLRAEVYTIFQRENLDVFNNESQFSRDHANIFVLSQKLSTKNLAKLIEDCERSEGSGFLTIKVGMFKKWTFSKTDIKRLLPKLKHLLSFKKTGKLYIEKDIDKLEPGKNFFRGGFNEPYCSEKCYSKAGAKIPGSVLKGSAGACALCKSPVEKNLYASKAIAFPFKAKTLFVCQNCLNEGQKFVEKIKDCCLCGKKLF